MKNTSGENKKMPDAMHKFYVLHFIENRTDCIENTADQQEEKGGVKTDFSDYCFRCDYNHPTHCKIANHRKKLKLFKAY